MIIRSSETNKTSSAEGLKTNHIWMYAIFLIVIIVSLSVFYLRFAWNRYQEIASSEAVMLAQSLESLLHPEHIAKLSGSEEDLAKSEYVMTKLSLTQLVETTNPIRFAYLMGERDGSIIILLDSESPDSPDYSPPGQIYEEADNIYWEPFRQGKTVLTDPITDRWGTWISALVPVKESSGGKIIAVLGIDYSAQEWNARLWKQMIPDVIIVLSLILLFLSLLLTWRKNSDLKELSRKLTFDEALYHSVFDQAPVGIAIVNDKSFVSRSEFGQMNINPMFQRILGRTIKDLEKVKWTEITHPEDLRADIDKFEQFKMGKIKGYSMEKRFMRADGTNIWTNMIVSDLLGSSENHSMHLCLLEDISFRKEAEKAIKESERSKSVLLSHLPGLAYRCKYDREGTMLIISDGCYNLTGYSPECFIDNRDLPFNNIITPEYKEHLWKEWERTIPNRLPYKCEYEIRTATGELKWVLEMGEGIYDERGEVEALEGIILDISDRKRVEDQLRYNGEHDVWTGLYNYRYLENLLLRDAKMPAAQKRAVIAVNLSAVHLLSMAYGLHYSQELIKQAAEALKSHCSERCLLFNAYENQFVFYLKDYQDKNELTAFCGAVVHTLEPVLDIERIDSGIGIVEISEDNKQDVEHLLQNLLIASEKAIEIDDKDFGLCFFDKSMENLLIREEEIKNELLQIAKSNEDSSLFLQFQPVLDLESNQICGFEALARLQSSQFGLVPPLEFIPIAEKSKLIIPLGEKIIIQALRFLKTLMESGHNAISLSINVSAIQLLNDDFVKNLFEMINQMQVNPENIGLELTESIFASNYEQLNSILAELQAYGIRIAIDDFGTGYSSLARERELNVDCLKIDKYFIDKLLVLKPEKTITADIISMGHKLGHCIVAEGVEQEEQLQYLKDNDCDKIQGYLISRPLDADAAIEMLNNTKKYDKNMSKIKERTDELYKAKAKSDDNRDKLQLILDSTAEAIYGIDLYGNCTFCNISCIKLLGYISQEDLLGKNMHAQIHHTRRDGTPFPVDECRIFQSLKLGKGFAADDEVFWRADGISFDVEYHAYPQIINGKVVGAVVTFMDITDRKQREEEILYLSCHDILTGLQNRRCFEENRKKIDIGENLPLSVIFADINGLKMTNDIFGHDAGDELIKKSAEILQRSCRENDVIARVGGDEFIILLPNTNEMEAKKILSRIRSGFKNAHMAAIKCSISLGLDIKISMEQSFEEVMSNAENAMYKDKTTNRKSINDELIDTLIDTLHSKNPREKQHSILVRELCGEVGAALSLSEQKLNKLKRAAYLHDIGKIILDDSILSKDTLSEEEFEKTKQHPAVGYRILNLFDDTLDLAEYIFSHHERWDGKGYPNGLKEEEIPLISRIILIVETYERVLNSGEFSLAERKKTAIKVIYEGAGKQFDPHIAELFARLMEEKNI